MHHISIGVIYSPQNIDYMLIWGRISNVTFGLVKRRISFMVTEEPGSHTGGAGVHFVGRCLQLYLMMSPLTHELCASRGNTEELLGPSTGNTV